MRTRKKGLFTNIRTEGGLLPADFLQLLGEGSKEVEGLTPADYHLAGNQKINEAINRSWNVLIGAWEAFKSASEKVPESDPGTTVTREKWLLPLFQELGYGRLQTAKAVEIEEKTYPASHRWTHLPIHLIGLNVDLDKRTSGVAGASRLSPHGMVQELLNRSDDYLWAFVSNGQRLRILRDNLTLTRQAFVEFDLASMMDGESYSDFVILWMLCHQSRVEADQPEHCWLEKWMHSADQQGTRALDKLRSGVEDAIEALGSGILAHPANRELKDKLRSGELDKQDYYRQILRIVYRIIFLFVAEDRELLFQPDADKAARKRYLDYYSARRLRNLAERKAGTKHGDLWQMLSFVFKSLGQPEGCPELALNALGSFLWSPEATPDLEGCDLSNRDLLEAVRHLSVTQEGNVRRIVDYRKLGAEELGSIYESLLEMKPDVHIEAGRFDLNVSAGNERKTSGSYYTPTSLVNCLLDSALDPVINDRLKGAKTAADAEKALLGLKVCDPACGSGHFLIAAAHRLAKRLASVRSGDSEPSPTDTQHALRDVVSHCLYGIDINPMAVELCKISLWLEAIEPGKPLGFLDHHIVCGNSLLGATPGLLSKGIPDDAFKPIEGDDKSVCSEFKKQNKQERSGQMELFDRDEKPWQQLKKISESVVKLEEASDNTIAGVRRKQDQYAEMLGSDEYRNARFIADAWCAAFVFKKTKKFGFPITDGLFRRIENNPNDCPEWMRDEIRRLAKQYQFLHLHIAFPDVFQPLENIEAEDSSGWKGGFDCVVGNPPWERTALEDIQFFAERLPEVLDAPTTAARKRIIQKLPDTHPEVYAEYLDARRMAAGGSALVSATGKYPNAASGRLNTYALFTELSWLAISPYGRAAVIVQTGLATDAPMEDFWRALIDSKALVSLFDFENRKGIFPAVHRSMKFCLLTLRGSQSAAAERIHCGFYLHEVAQLQDPSRTYTLDGQVLSIVNPNTGQPPVCRSQRDLDLICAIHRRHPILMRGDKPDYRARAWRALMSAGSSQHYRSLQDLSLTTDEITNPERIVVDGDIYLALLESKQVHQFDPSFATYRGVSDEDLRAGNPRPTTTEERDSLCLPQPRFWGVESVVEDMFNAKEWSKPWSVGVRDVTNSTNERTAIMCIFPRIGLVQPLNGVLIDTAMEALWIVAAVNSFACDYVARQKTPGSHLNVTIFSQLPVPESESSGDFARLVLPRSLELSYVVNELSSFAEECGYVGPQFLWDDQRRSILRNELDAAFFHIYEIDRQNVDYIMESSFSGSDGKGGVKGADIAKYGDYRTKLQILEIYDEMAEAMRSGKPYQTHLDPPPGPPADENGNFLPLPEWKPGQPKPKDWPPHIHPPKGCEG